MKNYVHEKTREVFLCFLLFCVLFIMSCGLKPVETEVIRGVYELDSDVKLKIFNWSGEVIVTPWEEEEKMELMAIKTTREGKDAQ